MLFCCPPIALIGYSSWIYQSINLPINLPQFQDWYAKELQSQLHDQSAEAVPIDLKMGVMKPLSAKWIASLFSYFKSKPSIIRNGFKEAGIVNCLSA